MKRPATTFIGTANGFAKEIGHMWCYKLILVGTERIYVYMEPPSTIHAGDFMFIVQEVGEGNK